jgi:hypothetical protein
MHPDPHADASIPERLYSEQQLKRGEAGHNGVQVIGNRRTEHGEKSIAHLAVDDPAILMHGCSHLLQRRRKARDRLF